MPQSDRDIGYYHFAATKKIDNQLRPIMAQIYPAGHLEVFQIEDIPIFIELLPTEKSVDAMATAGIVDYHEYQLVTGVIDPEQTRDFFVARAKYGFDVQLYAHTLDQKFTNKDYLRVDFGPDSADIPTAIAVSPSGDAFVVGTAAHGNERNIAIVKFSAETGDLDPVFNNGLPATINPCDADLQLCTFDPTAIQIDADGLPVIAGQLSVDGVESMFALRLRNNGTIDTGFAPNAAIPGVASVQIGQGAQTHGLVLQEDGRVVLGGNTVNGDHGQDFLAARLFVRGQKIFRDEFGP